MNRLIIEELSQTIADQFMELYVEADIVGEKRVYIEVRNSGEETDQIGKFSWRSFLSRWATPESAVNRLNRLWDRKLVENLMFFYTENRQEISLELIELLSGSVTGTIKVTSTPCVLTVQVEK